MARSSDADKNLRRLVFYAPSDVVERLEQLARRERRKVGPQVLWLIEQALEQRAKEAAA